MAEPLRKSEPSLYETDFHAWTQEQAERLKERAHNRLDWDDLAEEIESLGRSQKREIRKRLSVLIQHLLKWEHQPERRCHSWQTTIGSQRLDLGEAVADSPSLRTYPEESLEWAWARGRRQAAGEMRVPLGELPAQPTYTLGQILDPSFMPGSPWSPEDLIRD